MLDPKTAEILKIAMAHIRVGNVALATKTAREGLDQSGDPVALNAFLGMISARNGDTTAAAEHLYLAHRGNPTDGVIAGNLIAILIETGDVSAALEIASWELAEQEPSLRIMRYRGFLSQSLDRFADAAQAYRYVVDRVADDFESWNNLGNALQPLGEFEASIGALERAVSLDPKSAPSRLNLAAAYDAAGRTKDAKAALEKMIRDFPDSARPMFELHSHFKRLNQPEKALAALEQAVAIESENAEMQLKLAIEYGMILRTAEAETAYRRALASDPHLAEAYLGLAIHYEHTNREEEFAPLIAMAELHGLDAGVLGFLRALEFRRAGQFAEALECITNLPATLEPERSSHIRATLLDRMGRSDEAFAAFDETNRLHQLDASDPVQRAHDVRARLRSDLQLLTHDIAASWPDPELNPDSRDPVFLVGFPRSGTTLLDTILMGHPRTTVLEEHPALNRVDDAIGGLAATLLLDDEAIRRARSHYFTEIGDSFAVSSADLLIDKSPLFLQKVPLIRRLFPNARFILALRHPCDVLLSCYMSNFRLNSAMSNFLRLEDAAEFYDLTFQHWQRSRELFAPDVHIIRYERLIENVEQEVRPLFEFLGLEWRAEALDHRSTAKARGLITTASYSQVTEPIYQRAAGRWVRYRDRLEPVLPVLRPWADAFGYEI